MRRASTPTAGRGGRHRPRAAAALLVLLLAAAPASACHGSSAGGASSTSPSRTPSRTPSTKPSATSSPPTPRATDASAGPLLTAAEVPAARAGERWREAGTTSREPSTFGTCQRFAMTSIGAERVVVRRYVPAGASRRPSGDRAGELVATFPDETTARRAFAVLRSWRDRCADRLPAGSGSRVGQLQDVGLGTAGATGAWYLLEIAAPSGGRGHTTGSLEALGMTVVRSRIALLSLVARHREPGGGSGSFLQEAMPVAVRREAARLG